jgi:hypothetical protein
MEIDRMGKLAAGMVPIMDLHGVSLSDPDEGTGDGIPKCPKLILDSVGQLSPFLE